MGLLGVRTIAELGPDYLTRRAARHDDIAPGSLL
jgi:hypothetical protein